MTAQSKVLPGLVYTPTATPNIAKRGGRYLVRWTEDQKRCRRTFGSYDAACAFRRDYVVPYKDGLVAVRPSTVDLSAGDPHEDAHAELERLRQAIRDHREVVNEPLALCEICREMNAPLTDAKHEADRRLWSHVGDPREATR